MAHFGERISSRTTVEQGRGGSRPPPLPRQPPAGPPWRKGTRRFDRITLVALIVAAIYWLFPSLVLIAMISFFGMPLAIAAMLAGLIALPLLVGHAIYWGLARGFPGGAAGAAMARRDRAWHGPFRAGRYRDEPARAPRRARLDRAGPHRGDPNDRPGGRCSAISAPPAVTRPASGFCSTVRRGRW